MSGFPDCNIGRTFTSTFYLQSKATKTIPIKHIYPDPIYLAREYKRMIDNSEVKNQSGLARKLNIFKVRICQILNLSKFNSLIIK